MKTIDEQTRATALFISNVLFRATLLGIVLLTLTSIPVLLLNDQLFAVHNSLIDISWPEYNVMLFSWLGNLKLLVFVFFLIPAIAIRWTLKKA